MTILPYSIAAAQTDEEKWNHFYEVALQFFKVPPSARTKRKIQGLFQKSMINAGLIDIFQHLLEIEVRYAPEKWMQDSYSPLFRSAKPDPLLEFIPDSFAKLAAKSSDIKTYVKFYLRHHHDILEADPRRQKRDLSDDRARFDCVLDWARSQNGPIVGTLLKRDKIPFRPGCPSWAIYEWILKNYPFLPASELERFRLRGRCELEVGAPHYPAKLLKKFGLRVPSAKRRREACEVADGLQRELNWTNNAFHALWLVIRPESESPLVNLRRYL